MEYFKRLAHGAGKQASVLSIKSRAAMESSRLKQKLATVQTDEEKLMINLGRKVCELYDSGIELDDSIVFFCQSAAKCKNQREDLQEQLTAIQKRAEKEIERANEHERQQNTKHPRMKHPPAKQEHLQQSVEATVIDANKVPPTQQAEIVGADNPPPDDIAQDGYITPDTTTPEDAEDTWDSSLHDDWDKPNDGRIAPDVSAENSESMEDITDTEMPDESLNAEETIKPKPVEDADNILEFSDYTVMGDNPDDDKI